MAARNRLARDELLLGGSRGQRQARCRRRGSGRALRHQGQRALSVACRAVSICRGNAWGQENPGLSGLNLESPDRENAGPCFAKKFEAAKTHRMSCRARTAETVEPVYSSASNAYPATRPAPCATHPSAKLIASCTPVVRIAMADCVRPIKCLGTIDIREDCATTPPSARQNPKIICITTAPTRKATKGVAICPAAKRSEEHTSELQSQSNLVCRLLLEKKKTK